MTKLVIVESPTKAKTLSKILGPDYDIQASMGHIRDLPTKDIGIDTKHDFTPTYEVPEKAKKNLNILKKALKSAKEVVLATDPDREGEAIAWHLYELLKPSKKSKKDEIKFERVVFHEITKSAIEEAFAHAGEINIDLVDAQQARRILDRLVGYKLSPLLWKKVRYGLSAGRVQSVAVRLVVERERERQAFKADEYWSIDAKFLTKAKEEFEATLYEKAGAKVEITKESEALKIKEDLASATYKITDVKKTERKRQPNPPYKTSTLQQAAANIYGFSAKKTMIAAQKLFEQGFITYHRTDSLNLSADFIDIAREYLKKELGKEYIPAEPVIYKTKSKNAQEAHEAIRPTNVQLKLSELKKHDLGIDEVKVYSLVFKRALESQSVAAVYDQTSVSITSNNSYVFRANGSIIKFDGWLGIEQLLGFEDDIEAENKLPNLEVGDVVKAKNIEAEQHFTQPPARYSDATLIKALEERGIGRPSTYAPTMSTITARGYVRKEGRYFVPEDVAYVVNDMLVTHFPNIVDYEFTALMEEGLDKIAEGEIKWVPVIREFYEPFEQILEQKEEELSKADMTKLGESDEKCPDCGRILYIKLGKYGKFLSCSGFPECEYAKPILTNGDELQDYGKCENCEDGQMILKQGRFGKFIACSNYPKCKTTKPYLDKIGMKCLTCTEGDIIVKKAKGRIFYGCSNYPNCKYASWKNPMEKKGDGEEETPAVA